MFLLRNSESGFVDIAMAVGIVSVGAIAAYFSSVSTHRQNQLRINIVNSADGFYSGEMAAVSALFKNKVSPLPDGRTLINTFSNTSG